MCARAAVWSSTGHKLDSHQNRTRTCSLQQSWVPDRVVSEVKLAEDKYETRSHFLCMYFVRRMDTVKFPCAESTKL